MPIDLSLSQEVPPILVRAVQYVRMSTEHQKYSTENQADVIAEYARRRGFEIAETYADDGKSGLSIEGRSSLKRLISHVESGGAEFRAILVYDISRWGRFQDADESAYYEYVCKRAGIQIHYCAEQFENDGSLSTTIIKNMKRAMAGEYSRELSSKVFKGQCKLIQLGYRQGGTAGFGMRRMLVDQNGHPKTLLKRGEHKSLQTDRVILVPGPEEEVSVVTEIYKRFTQDGEREVRIAEWLNEQKIPTETNGQWTVSMVRQILTNEKYIGNNVYNRVSFKLKKKRVHNSPEMWVRANGTFEALVDAESFFIARGILQERGRAFTDQEMVEKLRELYRRHDGLSAALIDNDDSLPSSASYRHRFGSLLEVYKLAGYAPERDYGFIQVNRNLRALYPNLLEDTVRQLEAAGAAVAQDEVTGHLCINGQYSASLVLGRCASMRSGRLRWRIHFAQEKPPDITIAVRMNVTNDRPTDFFLLPFIDVGSMALRLGEFNAAPIETYRFETLEYFVGMAKRTKIEVAA